MGSNTTATAVFEAMRAVARGDESAARTILADAAKALRVSAIVGKADVSTATALAVECMDLRAKAVSL
jgi:hypothetical protein